MRLNKIIGWSIAAIAGVGKASILDDIDMEDVIIGGPHAINISQILVDVLKATANSGGITDAVEYLYDHPDSIEGIANVTAPVLKSTKLDRNGNLSIAYNGVGIHTSLGSILDSLVGSKLFFQILDGSLLNATNRDYFAYILMQAFGDTPAFSNLIKKMGDGLYISVDNIADVVVNTTSKNPRHQSQGKQTSLKQERIKKRDNSNDTDVVADGTRFLGNLVNIISETNVTLDLINEVTDGIYRSNTLVPITMELLKAPHVASVVADLVAALYRRDSFKGMDTGGLFEQKKKEGVLVEPVQVILTYPRYEPALARVFKKIEDSGALWEAKLNLYGYS